MLANDKMHVQRGAVLLAIWLVFGLALAQIDVESLWADETWSIWVAQQPWPQMLQHVAGDVHPPLYFALLKIWAAFSGVSAYATRFLSTAWGLLGLLLTFALGRRLLDTWTGLLALVWLGAHGLLLYYLREVRMYSLVFALSALSMWVYLQWLAQPSPARGCAYALVAAALAYVHYLGPLVILAQGVYLALAAPRRLGLWLLACCLALLLFLPWAPALLAQIAAHPGGPHQTVTPTDGASIRHLLWVLSGGAGIVVLAPFVLGRGLQRLWASPATRLLWLWGGIPPAVLLAVNAWVMPLYEVRNVIGVLPAVALAAGAGLRYMAWRPLIAPALVLLVAANLAFAPRLRPAKSPWRQTFEAVLAERTAGAHTLLKIVEPASPEAYYANTLRLRNAQTVEIQGRMADPAKLQLAVQSLPPDQPVWVIMPANIPDSWLVLAGLARTRSIGFRRGVDYLLFYRFDPGPGDHGGLQFNLGQQFRYDGAVMHAVGASRVGRASRASHRLAPTARAGEQLCFEIPLTTLSRVRAVYSYGVHLVDRRPGLVAQVDHGIEAQSAGAALLLTPCLTLPADLPPERYAVHFVIYNRADGERLPVFERTVSWGDALILAMIDTRPQRSADEQEAA